MVAENCLKNIRFEKPGKYRIKVGGRLNVSWSDRMAGMQITSTGTEVEDSVTTLIGRLRDQTQLSGVLNSLYDLHLPILLVEYIRDNNGVGLEPDGCAF